MIRKSTEAQILGQLRNHGQPCRELAGLYLRTRDTRLVEPVLRGLVGHQAGLDLLSEEALKKPDFQLQSELAIDSLGLLELSLLIEDVFEVPINADELLGISALSGLSSYVLSELQKSLRAQELAGIRPDTLREISFASAREPRVQ